MYLNCITFTHNKLIDKRLSISKIIQPNEITHYSFVYDSKQIVTTYVVTHMRTSSYSPYMNYLLTRVI